MLHQTAPPTVNTPNLNEESRNANQKIGHEEMQDNIINMGG